jgi:hypothetical protein
MRAIRSGSGGHRRLQVSFFCANLRGICLIDEKLK